MPVRHVPASPGVTLAVDEHPNPGAPPLVLLHGIGSRGETWRDMAAPLNTRFHLYIVDHRGHGDSAKPDSGYLLDNYADDLAALIDNLGLASPAILGHSLGALVAMTWAARHPSRARRIVLEDPPLRSEPSVLELFDGWIQLNSLPVDQVAAWFKQENPTWSDADCLRRAEVITTAHPNVFHDLRAATETALASGETDRIPGLEGIETPFLLIRGDIDAGSMSHPADVARLLALLPHTRDHQIPGVGHSIHRDTPDPFLAATLAFLDEEAVG
jgi:pimeloyl-ACP methyl ester carboxylesterase